MTKPTIVTFNKPTIKVTVEYIGHWYTPKSEDYRLLKIIGTAKVTVPTNDGGIMPARVGDVISESQAMELASHVELTTIRKSDGR